MSTFLCAILIQGEELIPISTWYVIFCSHKWETITFLNNDREGVNWGIYRGGGVGGDEGEELQCGCKIND